MTFSYWTNEARDLAAQLDVARGLAVERTEEIASLRAEVERETERALLAEALEERARAERDEARASLARVTAERDRLAAATVREGAAAQRAEAECARLREQRTLLETLVARLREEVGAAEARGFAAGVEAADRALAELSWGEQSNVRMVVRALRPSPAPAAPSPKEDAPEVVARRIADANPRAADLLLKKRSPASDAATGERCPECKEPYLQSKACGVTHQMRAQALSAARGTGRSPDTGGGA